MVFCDFHVEAGGGESKDDAFVAVGADDDTDLAGQISIMSRSSRKNDEVRIRNCTANDVDFWSGTFETAKFTAKGQETQRGRGTPVRWNSTGLAQYHITVRCKSNKNTKRGHFQTLARDIRNGPNHILYAYKEGSRLVLLNGPQFSEKFRYMDNSDNPYASRWDTLKNPDSHKVTETIKCPIVRYIHDTFDVLKGSTFQHKWYESFGWERTSTEETTMTIKTTAELSSKFKHGEKFEFNAEYSREQQSGFESFNSENVEYKRGQERIMNIDNTGNAYGYGDRTWRFTHYKAYVMILGNRIDVGYNRTYEDSEDHGSGDLGEYVVEVIKYEL